MFARLDVCDDVIIYDVITSYEKVYVNNSSQNKLRAMKLDKVSLYLCGDDASTDMQHDLSGSLNQIRYFDLT